MNDLLLKRAQKGDAHAFEEWIAPFEQGIYRICLGLTCHPEDARDCAQETILKAYRALKSFRSDAKPTTWLYRIAYNACQDTLRKRRPSESFEALSEQGAVFRDGGAMPYERLEEKERLELLRHAIAQLSQGYRSVITLQLQGLSYGEIAHVVGANEGTVKSRISRAKEQLREILESNRELFSASSVQLNERGQAQ